MHKIFWTNQATIDLKNIYNFIAEDSIKFAELTRFAIINKTQNIKTFLKVGRIVPEYGSKNIREVFYGNYRIIYEIKQKNAYITTVFHSNKLLET